MSRIRSSFALVHALIAVLIACVVGSAAAATKPPIPANGAYLGAILLQGQTTISQFNREMGINHAMFMEFVGFPGVLSSGERTRIGSFIGSCTGAGAIPALTLELSGGLNSYTTNNIRDFADFLNGFDVPIILRWCHEMNGSWYAWGQQPTLYVAKFREFADIIHQRAPGVAMAWTPNQGWGYSWSWGSYAVAVNSPDFRLLDTNGDGKLTESDDPYGPYYPGDAFVDWVGLSFYHWGNDRGYNQLPWLGKWGHANGVSNAIPNFHNIFAVGHNKPMFVTETSAFYDPMNIKTGNVSEAAIKQNWIQQVYNLTDSTQPRLNVAFPQIKAILWFNVKKFESEVNGDVDWRLNNNANVLSFYRQTVSNSYFVRALYAADNITLGSAPATVAPNQTCSVSVQYSARTNRDIILTLLDAAHDYAWYGGQTRSVTAGQGSVTFSLAVQNYPQNGTGYVWDAIIVPAGSNWSNTLDHVQMPVTVFQADQVSFTSVPQPLRPQQTATIAFSYRAVGTGKRLSVDLLDPTRNYVSLGGGNVNLPEGAGTVSVPLTVQGSPTSGSYYVLSAFIAQGTDSYLKATATAQTNVTVGGDSLMVSSAPLSVQGGQSYTLQFQYYCDQSRYLTVDLLRPSTGYSWYGGINKLLARGSGTVSMVVNVINQPPAGQDYQWNAFLSTRQGDYLNATTTTVVRPVSVLQDGLNILTTPMYLQPGQTYPITLRYSKSGSGSKYVHVDLLDPVHGYAWYGGISSNLPTAQTSGDITVRLPVINNPPAGANYILSAFIAPVGQDWTAATAADLKSAKVSWDNIQFVSSPSVILPRSTVSVTFNYNIYPGTTGAYLNANLICPAQNYAWFGGTNVALPAGTGQLTLNFPVAGSPASGTYILDAFVSTKAGVFTNVTAQTQAVTSVQVDSLSFNTYPTTLWTPSTWTVKLNYNTLGPRKIRVDLVSGAPGYIWRAGNEVTVPAGSGVASINVAVPNTFASGSHIWTAYIAPIDGSYSTRTVDVTSPQISALRNPVQIVSAPSSVQRGQTYNVTLSWDVSQNSEAHIDILKNLVYSWHGGAWSNIGSGVSTRVFQVTVSPSAPLGTNYLWSSWIGPVGQGYAGRTAVSLQSPVSVVGP